MLFCEQSVILCFCSDNYGSKYIVMKGKAEKPKINDNMILVSNLGLSWTINHLTVWKCAFWCMDGHLLSSSINVDIRICSMTSLQREINSNEYDFVIIYMIWLDKYYLIV